VLKIYRKLAVHTNYVLPSPNPKNTGKTKSKRKRGAAKIEVDKFIGKITQEYNKYYTAQKIADKCGCAEKTVKTTDECETYRNKYMSERYQKTQKYKKDDDEQEKWDEE
jgi:hypothetical protein